MKKQIRNRYCSRCNEYKPCISRYKPICAGCKQPNGGIRGTWQMGKATPIKRMEALGVL